MHLFPTTLHLLPLLHLYPHPLQQAAPHPPQHLPPHPPPVLHFRLPSPESRVPNPGSRFSVLSRPPEFQRLGC